MEKGVFYESPTGNGHFMREILQAIRPPRRVLTVVGSQWPMFFKDLWPDATVISFDNNPDQIRFNEEQVVDVTHHKPLLLDVRSQRFTDLLEEINFDFFYFSNISDYLSPIGARHVAEVITDVGTPTVLAATLGENRIQSARNQQSIHEFVEWLESAGYRIEKHTDPSTNIEVRDFYLATLREEKVKGNIR